MSILSKLASERIQGLEGCAKGDAAKCYERKTGEVEYLRAIPHPWRLYYSKDPKNM